MATTAAEPVFIDTNILIYGQQQLSPFHAAAVAKLHHFAAAGHPLWISRQVLREYLAAMSRPGATAPPVTMARIALTALWSCWPARARSASGRGGDCESRTIDSERGRQS